MNDPGWPFDQGPNVAAFTTRRVAFSGAPILMVLHYSEDHSWAFMDGGEAGDADLAIISMAQVVQHDSTVREVADLPPGWVATRRRVGDAWVRERTNPSDLP
ncbi:MAG: hypothetical protein ACJ8J0_10645 [Longimicrobiaceae bacterium]